MAPDYVSDISLCAEGDFASRVQAKAAQNIRQSNWLKRKTISGEAAATWRPRKRHRRSAYVYTCTEHAFFKEVVDDGLLHFQQPEEQSKRSPAINWDRLGISPDQGSGGISMINHWLHKLRINVDATWDVIDHGTHNDIHRAVDDVYGKNYVNMQMIRFNIPFSPYDQGLRWSQVVGSIDDIFKNNSPNTFPLWSDFIQEMLGEPAGLEFRSRDDPEGDFWWHLKEGNHCFRTKLEIHEGAIWKYCQALPVGACP